VSKITVEDFNYKGVHWESMSMESQQKNIDIATLLVEFFDFVIRQTRLTKTGKVTRAKPRGKEVRIRK